MVHQGGKLYNNLFKRFLKINNTEMYSTYNEGKYVVTERFIRTLKSKIFKHMRAVSKNVYFDVLDNVVNKYKNTVHRTMKMKPINITSDSYQTKILEKKFKQNEALYDLDRKAAKISTLSSENLKKYEYLTGENLGYKPSALKKTKFEYFPLGKVFNKGLNEEDKNEGILKRQKKRKLKMKSS